MKWSRGSQQFLGYLFHHFYSFLQHFPLRQAPVVYAAREGFGAACKVLVQYQAMKKMAYDSCDLTSLGMFRT